MDRLCMFFQMPAYIQLYGRVEGPSQSLSPPLTNLLTLYTHWMSIYLDSQWATQHSHCCSLIHTWLHKTAHLNTKQLHGRRAPTRFYSLVSGELSSSVWVAEWWQSLPRLSSDQQQLSCHPTDSGQSLLAYTSQTCSTGISRLLCNLLISY